MGWRTYHGNSLDMAVWGGEAGFLAGSIELFSGEGEVAVCLACEGDEGEQKGREGPHSQ
jgi:hypothetical protein